MADWQVRIDDLVLGAGTDYPLVTGPEGLGLPEIRTSDQPRPQDHGLYWGSDFLGGRKFVLDVFLFADSPDDAARLMDTLATRWQPPEGPTATKILTIDIPGWEPRLSFGRPRRLAFDTGLLRSGVVKAALEFSAADPRLYEAMQQVGVTGLPIVSGGRTYNRAYPLVYPGEKGTSGTILATNAGNYPTRPLATITGPAANPRIENVTTGETLAFAYTLAAGQFFVIDFDARTVLEGGTSSRYYTVTPASSWFELVPGLNEVRLRADAYQADARLELRWRSSWL